IGTYVRATSESDEEVGDKASDALRVTARDLRVKVIGEGANLGVTQKARIEFGLAGGRCNSDAIDNSAGVNSSDMEVNIKIALGAAERAGRLTREDRNTLLASMTDDVADLVLRNNYLQTLSLSLTQRHGREDVGYQRRLMTTLESRGLLDRNVEFLPSEEVIDAREADGKILARAELAVLLAYAKITLFSDLLETDVPDDAYLGRELYRYFPKGMHADYGADIEGHRLRREIIATQLSNSIINRGGATLIQRVSDTTGADVDDIARAFAAVRDSYGLTALNEEIDALDTKIDGGVQLELYAAIQELVIDRIGWFLTNTDLSAGLMEIVERYRRGLADFRPTIAQTLLDPVKTRLAQQRDRFVAGGVPEALADTIAHLPVLSLIPDMVQVEDETARTPEEVAGIYFRVGAEFKLGRIDGLARDLEVGDYYDALALDRARQSLAMARRRMTAAILSTEGGFEAWSAALGSDLTRTIAQVSDIVERGDLTVSRIAVAAGLLADLSA
ncbi:MAG: NAD-glutamate dehydrogenase, partial [Hyphomicrobiaceae bacterium]|nr:NAD-glutamate dehydrogenase [Hyphomicrobiaceae bacterium]